MKMLIMYVGGGDLKLLPLLTRHLCPANLAWAIVGHHDCSKGVRTKGYFPPHPTTCFPPIPYVSCPDIRKECMENFSPDELNTKLGSGFCN